MEITSLSLDLAAAGGKLRAKGISRISSEFYCGASQLMGPSLSSEDLVKGTGQCCLVFRGSPEQPTHRGW